MDNYKDFAYTTVAVAPAPPETGLSLTVAAGTGAVFAAPPFNAVVAPVGVVPLSGNAEQVRVTTIVGDVLTIERHQAGSNARTITAGDQVFAGVTAKTLTDLVALVEAETTRAMGAEALKAPLASPALTGTPKAPTGAAKDNTTQVATDQFVQTAAGEEKTRAETAEALLAPKASPALTGTPTVPTAAEATNTTQAASTAFAHTVATTAKTAAEAAGDKAGAAATAQAAAEAASVALAPAASGDETGVTDTAALAAAMPAKGSLVLRSTAPYFVTKLPECGPEQGILCVGVPVVNMVGNGVCLWIHNPAMSVGGGEAEFLKNVPGRFDPFVIDLSKAGTKAVGVQIGDINSVTWHGPVVRGGKGAENIGWLFKSEVAWCEDLDIKGVAIGNTNNVVFTNGGASTGAFDYSHIEMRIGSLINQNSVVMEKAVGLWGSFLRFTGNCFSGVGNTGVAWKLGADNTSVQLLGTHLEIQLETDGSAGVGHVTIERGTKAEVKAEGVLSFRTGGSIGWVAGNITQPDTRFAFDGIVDVDENLGQNKQGEGLNVLGGSTWSRGFTTIKEAKVELGVNGGDYFSAVLASGVNALKLNNSTQNRARRIQLKVTQPAAGEPATMSFTEPGNNLQGNAQTVSWAAGAVGSLQAAHGAIDVIELTTTDGQNWFAAILGAKASVDSFLGLMRPVIAASIIPSTESAIGVAFKAVFVRCVIPVTGTLKDLTVFNGTVVNGNTNVGVYDTGQAIAGKYTPLYETGAIAAAGESKPQVIASPELAVTAGQHVMVGVMNSGTTHKYGATPNANHAAWEQLPASFMPSGGGASAKVLAVHTFAELKYIAITEAEMEQLGTPSLVVLGRIV